MGRPAARIKQDEVARMIRAAQSCGLRVNGVAFDGNKISVMIGESGEIADRGIDGGQQEDKPIREPQV